MGSCPSADLFYGVILGGSEEDYFYEELPIGWARLDDEAEELADDVDPSEVGMGSWEDELARRRGLGESPLWVSEHEDPVAHARWAEWSDARAALIKAEPVELDTYGGSEYTCWAIRVKESVTWAYDWGYAEVKTLTADPAWDDQIRAFMELLELPMPEGAKIGWFVTCAYG
jgi:hypothetical protein